VKELGYHGYEGEENANSAVLVDSDVYDLQRISSLHIPTTSFNIDKRTLNQVNPLRGILNQPFSFPPVHFCTQGSGQTQFLGCTPRK
jgi:hypothetical protein